MTNQEYEIFAAVFRRMTGTVAPGKDVPAGMYQPPYECRSGMWEQWYKYNSEAVHATIWAIKNTGGE